MSVLIRASRIIDGTGGPPIMDGAIVVDGARIRSVGNYADQAGDRPAEIIDLGERTILPGLIDAHGHLGMDAYGNEDDQNLDGDVDVLYRAVGNARRCLESGVTAMRIVGEKGFTDIVYK